jgi:exodeoxyribonuclease-5
MGYDYNFRYKKREAAEGRSVHDLVGEDELSEDQLEAYKEMVTWVTNPGPLLRFGGYAGTGKSTLLALLAYSHPHKRIAFCAYTGKAAGVLRQKIYMGASHVHEVSTIHSLIYRPIVDGKTGQVVHWGRRDSLDDYDLIVVDEASMVDEGLYQDLSAYGIPILATGDHGQLPPVMGNFNLMEDPDLRLERIHRQAEGNPILQLSAHIRKYGDLPDGLITEENIQYIGRSNMPDLLRNIYTTPDVRSEDAAVLCYMNKTRQEINTTARQLRFPDHPLDAPLVGDQLICLRNAKDTVFNGMRGTLTGITKYSRDTHCYRASVSFPDDEIEFDGPVSAHQFGQLATFKSFEELAPFNMTGLTDWDDVGLLMDYGYALTVHKAQGSAFECVVLVYERPRGASDDDFKRWLYTGVTRCADMLFIVLPD